MRKDLQRDRYEKLHELWQIEHYRNLSPFYLTRTRIIRKLADGNLGNGLPVLDVGCGTGDLLSSLSPLAVACIGIDLSQRALKIANRKIRGASFLIADARALPFRAQHFHMTICSEVLEHLESDVEAVGEISRTLSEHGFAIFSVPQNPKYWTAEDTFDGHLRRYRMDNFNRMLERGGLEIELELSWGFPLAYLFRRYFSTRLFNAGLHRPMARGKAYFARVMAIFLRTAFQFDDLFNGLGLGLGIIALTRKTGLEDSTA